MAQLSHDQLIANIDAMEKQGAQPHEVQSYLNSLKTADTGAGQMGNPEQASSAGYGGYQPAPTPIGGAQNTPAMGNPFGTPFSVTGQENPLQAAGKFAGNIAPSAINDFAPLVTNPQGAFSALGSVLHGGLQEAGRALGSGETAGQPKTSDEQTFDNLVQQYKENYFTSPENAEKKIVEDPAGFITDAATLFLGGGGAAAKGADIAAGTTKAELLAGKTGLKTASDVAHSLPFPIEDTIKSGAVSRDAIFKSGNILTPEFAQGRIDDIAQKLENFQQGLGSSFRNQVDINKATMDGLIQKGKDVLLNESSGKFQGLVNNAVTRVAGLVTKPVGVAGQYVKEGATYALSHITGLEPEDIKNIVSNPNLFTKAALDAGTRTALTDELSQAIKQKQLELSETGTKYKAFRAQSAPVTVSQQGYVNILKNNGIDATYDPKKGWDLNMGKESTPLSPADVSALKEYLNQYATDDIHTGNSFLNARQAANLKLAKFDKLSAAGRTTNLQKIGSAFYNYLNTVGRPQIPGLEAADAETSPLIQYLEQIKKDFIDRLTGEMKDTAASKLANAGNKPALLARVEKLIPGISEKLQNLSTMENIAAAAGNKIGNYTRAMSEILGLSGTANIFGGPAAAMGVGGPASLVLGVMSNPAWSVPILRAMGYSENVLSDLNDSAKAVAPFLQGPNIANQAQNQGLVNPQNL